MLSAIRSRITYVNVVATLVLVFAMTGGAYAAKKYLITSIKQISPSALKQLQGKSGAAGPAGAAGVQGPAGLQGSVGAKGDTGAAGKEGPQGKQGDTGPTGPKGAAGSPWTAGGTLPEGKTETGAWSYGETSGEHPEEEIYPSISFPIQLPAELGASNVHYINLAGKEVTNFLSHEQTSTVCTGTASAPTADPGNLCIYTGWITTFNGNPQPHIFNGSIQKAVGEFEVGASTVGAVLQVEEPGVHANGRGTWAVTAPE